MLVYWPFFRVELRCHLLFFVKITILLQKHLQVLRIREIHILNHIIPGSYLPLMVERGSLGYLSVACRVNLHHVIDGFEGIFKGPHCHLACVPVIVDVVFILIRTGNSQHHILSLYIRPVHPLFPEA